MLKPSIIGCATITFFVLLFGAGRPLIPHANAATEPLLVIVAAAFPANDVSFATLKETFRGRPATLAGQRLVPVNHPADVEPRVSFDQVVLKLRPAEVGRYWVDAKIRDVGRPPTTAGNSDLAVRIVASLPNAISYATRAMITPKVKALTVDGKASNDSGYALKP